MIFYKSCEPQYHVKNCKTLKVGTMYSYRCIEDKELKDIGEGSLVFSILFEGVVEVPRAWFNLLSGSTIKFSGMPGDEVIEYVGRIIVREQNLFIDRMTTESVVLKDSSLIVERESFDCFIYCMSKISSAAEGDKIFQRYTDSWYVECSDLKNFSEGVARELLKAAVNACLKGELKLPEGLGFKDLSISMRCDEVKYICREIHISNATLFPTKEIHDLLEDVAYIKPPVPFEKDREYRIQMVIYAGPYIVSPWCDSVILSAFPILEYVK